MWVEFNKEERQGQLPDMFQEIFNVENLTEEFLDEVVLKEKLILNDLVSLSIVQNTKEVGKTSIPKHLKIISTGWSETPKKVNVIGR